MPTYPYQPIYEVTRGDTIESVHYGAVAVVDAAGRLVSSYGDPQAVTYLRSTAKPFQALPFIEAGGQEKFGFDAEEIALMCASHSGTEQHVAVAERIQHKAGVAESELQCGVHLPMGKAGRQAMILAGLEPHPNHHNCSGKHSGMLAHAKLKDAPIETYLEPDHPVQQAILQAFAEMCGLKPHQVQTGIDGCSAPNFAVPLSNAAWGWARLADPSALTEGRAAAIHTITQAMMAHPFLVSGPDRFDLALMTVGNGRIVSKGGAEGYQGVGLLPGALGPDSPALGVTIKISDGDAAKRSYAQVTVEVLRQLGALSDADLAAFEKHAPRRPVANYRETQVGEARPIFKLQSAERLA